MFQNQLVLRAKGEEERMYSFTCEPSSPLGEVLNAIKSMEDVVVDQIKKLDKEKSKSVEEV